MKATSMSRIWLRARLSVARLLHDRSGVAATEFAVIAPVMLVMFFGTVEISSGVAVDRKITLTARTLSDLTSQAAPSSANAPDAPVTDAYLQNVFTASVAIVQPYCATPTQARLSEIYVDSNKVAKIQWSKAATFPGCTAPATLTTSSRNAGDVVTSLVPAALLVKQTYLLLSELSYLYTPAVGYVMGKAGVTLNDVAYTRPRQVVCVTYNNLPAPNPTPCPTP
jgi:Flp pilus assembly protein TadG